MSGELAFAITLVPAPNFMENQKFVSRGGLKLDHALRMFGVDTQGLIVLDVGSSTGGFVDCLLQSHAAKVYSVDTAYGELAWKLRQDPRVVVLERTNILHLDNLAEPVDLVTIDVTFTSLIKVLPVIKKFLKPTGQVIALLKPQYENQPLALRNKGVIPPSYHQEILSAVIDSTHEAGFKLQNQTPSPITGTGGNTEFLIHLVLT